MRVVFRADANPELGTGHVMRCLCLADALRGAGASVAFASRDLPGHLQQALADRGYAHLPLPGLDPLLGWHPDNKPAETAWPTNAQLADADATLQVSGAADWLVVDHYGLGLPWERATRALAGRQMALDDLGRHHAVDVLLDQNHHPDPAARYLGRLPPGTTTLLGPRHALLRPEFAALRQGLVRRSGPVRRVLVFMGGMDTQNLTGVVLQAWDLLRPSGVAVDVVIGANHPAKADIERWCDATASATCHVQTPRMAELMAQADLAVGAGGGTTWERCAMGLPTLALCVADNQRAGLDASAASGFLYVADAGTPHTPQALAAQLAALMDGSAWRQHMSSTAMAAVDGQGAQRVVAALSRVVVQVRPAVEADGPDLHRWRNDPRVRAVSTDSAPIHLDDHLAWFGRVLADPNRHLLLGAVGSEPVGVVRFDVAGHEATVSIYLNPACAGRSLGLPLLNAAQQWLQTNHPGVHRLVAQVLPGNQPSVRLFERAGYRCGTQTFALDLTP